MNNPNNLIGLKYGRLEVIKKINECGKAKWLCKCECGQEKIILADSLKSGKTKSCGCLRKEKAKITMAKKLTTHNKSREKIYHIWNSMKARCYYHKSYGYKNYGARGIKICDEWLNDFMNFYNWAIENGYKEGLSIDRIDVNGDYEPSNCRWATRKEQANNKRVNKIVTYKGEKYTISQLSELIKIPYETLLWRIKHNWNENELSIKVNLNNKNIRRIL